MPNALQRLIADRRAEKGWSYSDIATRGKMSRSTIYKIATQELDGMPRRTTLKALAKGLGLPERVVRDAAIQSARMGTFTEDLSEWEQVVIGHSRHLSDRQRKNVLDLVESMLDDNQ